MNIDSHQHFWHYDPVRYAWITEEMAVLRRDFLPEQLVPELAANRIDRSIAVQAEPSEDETDFLLELATRCKQVVGVVGWVDLTARDVEERIEKFTQRQKLRGFRHIVQSEPDDWFLLRDDFCHGIGLLKSFGLTYDILIYARQLPAAIEFVERFPDQRFVLDHIAKPSIRTGEMEPWAQNIHMLAANHNVYCKVSGMVTEASWRNWAPEDFTPYLDVVFEAFGTNRLMFGSDWPVCLLAADYGSVLETVASYVRKLPQEQQRNVFGLNAARFYGIDRAHGSTDQG
jgi:L-fuconolactonase